MLRLPHCVKHRLTDGGEVVSLMYWRRSLPPRISLLLISVTGSVKYRATVRLEGLGKQKNKQWSHREFKPYPSGLQHRASTNSNWFCFDGPTLLVTYAPRWAPLLIVFVPGLAQFVIYARRWAPTITDLSTLYSYATFVSNYNSSFSRRF
jgi:hypothetical protein